MLEWLTPKLSAYKMDTQTARPILKKCWQFLKIYIKTFCKSLHPHRQIHLKEVKIYDHSEKKTFKLIPALLYASPAYNFPNFC